MIKEVFITPQVPFANERRDNELEQGLILTTDGLPDGLYIDLGVRIISGKNYYIGVQIIP